MINLDRRVAELRGWSAYFEHRYFYRGEPLLANITPQQVDTYSPSTNLLQAYQLWDEARPEGWVLMILQGSDGVWQVGRRLHGDAYHAKFVLFADLPRAITQAWVEAREGK